MPVNLDKPQNWKADVALSVDMYNSWFMTFAPVAFRSTRLQTTKSVEAALKATGNLTNIKPSTLRAHPSVLSTLRMSTCPPEFDTKPRFWVEFSGQCLMNHQLRCADLNFV